MKFVHKVLLFSFYLIVVVCSEQSSSKILKDLQESVNSKEFPKIIKALASFKKQFGGVKYSIPYVVVVGPQSSGKSTFLEQFLQLPSNIVKHGTGTRAPLEIHLEQDLTIDKPVIHFQGKEIDVEEITLTTNKFEDNKSFSREVLHLHIRSPDVMDMIFIDTPGLIPAGEERDSKIVEQIVKEQIQDKERIIVCMSKTGDYDTQWIIDKLGSMLKEPNWMKRTIFVFSFFDDYVNKLNTGTEANSFFSQAKKGLSNHYISLWPPGLGANLDGPDRTENEFSTLVERIKSIPKHEEQMFNNWKEQLKENNKKVSKSQPFDEAAYGPLLGIRNAMNSIQKLFIKKFQESLPDSRNEIKKQYEEILTDIEQTNEMLKSSDPDKLRSLFHDYINSYIIKLRDFMEFDSTEQSFSDDFNNNKTGQTLEQEDEAFSKSKFSKSEKWNTLVSRASLKNVTEIPEWDFLLGGQRQFHRLLNFLKVIAFSIPPRIWTKSEWHNAHSQIRNSKPDWEGVVGKFTLRSLLEHMKPLCEWATYRMAYILDRQKDFVHSALLNLPHFNLMGKYKLLLDDIDRHYQKYVMAVRAETETFQDNLLSAFTLTFSHDMAWRYSKVYPDMVTDHYENPSIVDLKRSEEVKQNSDYRLSPEQKNDSSGSLASAKPKSVAEEMHEHTKSAKEINAKTALEKFITPLPRAGSEIQPSSFTHEEQMKYYQTRYEDAFRVGKIRIVENFEVIAKAYLFLSIAKCDGLGSEKFQSRLTNHMYELILSTEQVTSYSFANPQALKAKVNELDNKQKDLREIIGLFDILQSKLDEIKEFPAFSIY